MWKKRVVVIQKGDVVRVKPAALGGEGYLPIKRQLKKIYAELREKPAVVEELSLVGMARLRGLPDYLLDASVLEKV